MKSVIIGLVSLLAGGGIGYFVGNKIATKKYKDLADKEVESVKKSLSEYYEEKINGTSKVKKAPSDKKDDKPQRKNNLMDKDSINYEKLKEEKVNYVKYAQAYSSDPEVKEGKPEILAEKIGMPYVISDVEYSEGEYNTETLHYYKDGVLCDDDFNVIKDVNGTVGSEALNSFGIYEGDAVYVRNDQHKIDYEILLEDDAYNRVAPRENIGVFPGDDDE
jgi:hypothetical protein